MRLTSAAVAIEALRQIPTLLLTYNPESFSAALLLFFLQFAASWVLLCAIIRKESKFRPDHKILLSSLLILFVIGFSFSVVSGFPQSKLEWLPITLPAVFTVLAILWKTYHTKIAALSGRILLVLSALSIASIRAALLVVESTEMVYLLYYLDVLVFPILVSALVLTEIENAHFKVSEILREKIRSEKNLKFALNNSLDIILTVNNAGLLLTWNNLAEKVFGYTDAQTIKKIHIDDLFSGNYCHKNEDRETVLDAVMEGRDGKKFAVNVRMKAFIEDGESYAIYVIKTREKSH